MVMKLVIAAICVVCVAGNGSSGDFHRTQMTGKVSQKYRNTPSASVHQSESSRTGYHEPITRHNQSTGNQQQKMPEQIQQIPNQQQQIPDQQQQIPDQLQPISDQQQQIPDQQQQMPDQLQPIPDQLQPISDQQQQIPDQQQQMPDQLQPIPDQLQPISDQQQQIPDHQQPIPDQLQPILDQQQQIPDQQQKIPDQQQKIPDQQQLIPDQLQPVPDQQQQIPDQQQQIPDQHQPTLEKFQSTDAIHHTMGYVHKASDHHQSRARNSTGTYKQTTSKTTAVTRLFQQWSKSSQLSSSEHPQKDTATKSPSRFDDLMIPGVFLCQDGKFRIYSSSVCDGQIDCPDSSDELPELCITLKTTQGTGKCRSNEFQCPSGKCVLIDPINFSDTICGEDNSSDVNNVSNNCSYPNLLCDNNMKCVSADDRCNGMWDCQDKTDELMSPVTFINSDLTFMCANGYCVSPNVLCNDFNDCADNSDEISCDGQKTTRQQFQDNHCAEYTCPSDGVCLRSDQVCNGVNDCTDGSDESSCDKSGTFLSDNKGLIISVSVLGGILLITIVVVICVTVYYKRKYKTLTQETSQMDSHPPPYWQAVCVSVADPLEKAEQQTFSHVNAPYGGTTAFPE